MRGSVWAKEETALLHLICAGLGTYIELGPQARGHRGTCVTSLAVCGDGVVAGEFLTSLTGFAITRTKPKLPNLLRVSADSGTVHVQSLHMLSNALVLGVFPPLLPSQFFRPLIHCSPAYAVITTPTPGARAS